MNPPKNLFATVLTYAAPSSNYRGESEENRTVLQKITRGNLEYTVISPESMRNALREILSQRGLPSNRSRLHNYVGPNGKPQLAVHFEEIPKAEKFADDFLFGYMVADPKKVKDWPKGHPAKRDSVLRMNLAVALSPYRFNATFHQSPKHDEGSAWENDDSSNLLHREVVETAYQYPFALAGSDVKIGKGPEWTRALLAAIGELSNVAGGHARSYFEMAPRSIVARLTPSLVAGFDTYGFNADGDFPELSRVVLPEGSTREGNQTDLPPSEFWLGGEIVRRMSSARREQLKAATVKVYENPQKLLTDLGAEAF